MGYIGCITTTDPITFDPIALPGPGTSKQLHSSEHSRKDDILAEKKYLDLKQEY